MNTVPVCLLANLYSGFFCIVSDGIYTVLLEDIYSNYCIQECILKKTEKSWDKRQMMLCIYYIEVMQLDCVNVIQVPSLSCVALQCDSSVKLLRLLSPPTQTSTFETASGSEIMARAEIFSFLLQKVSFLPLPSLTCLLLQIFFLQGKSTRKEGRKERKKNPPSTTRCPSTGSSGTLLYVSMGWVFVPVAAGYVGGVAGGIGLFPVV